MLAVCLLSTYERLKHLGYVRSKVAYSRDWLGRGETYLRDYEHRPQRLGGRVSARTIEVLRARLCETAERVPRQEVAREVREIVVDLDRSTRIADFLDRGRGTPR